MSFFVENTGGAFESVPPGLHLARCYRIVDLGTQKSEYMGQVKFLHKIMLGWEIHGVNDNGTPLKMRDGRPFAIFKTYTLSWSEKANLRLDLQSWRGKPFSSEEMRRFDLKTVLNAWCMLNVIERQSENGKTYVNVDNITPVPAMIKKAGLPEAINENEIFNLEEPDMKMYEKFSEYLKAKIQSSPEWQRLNIKQPAPVPEPVIEPITTGFADDSEDIPF